jgi:hypothetical protein
VIEGRIKQNCGRAVVVIDGKQNYGKQNYDRTVNVIEGRIKQNCDRAVVVIEGRINRTMIGLLT